MAPLPVRAHPLFHNASSPDSSSSLSPPSPPPVRDEAAKAAETAAEQEEEEEEGNHQQEQQSPQRPEDGLREALARREELSGKIREVQARHNALIDRDEVDSNEARKLRAYIHESNSHKTRLDRKIESLRADIAATSRSFSRSHSPSTNEPPERTPSRRRTEQQRAGQRAVMDPSHMGQYGLGTNGYDGLPTVGQFQQPQYGIPPPYIGGINNNTSATTGMAGMKRTQSHRDQDALTLPMDRPAQRPRTSNEVIDLTLESDDDLDRSTMPSSTDPSLPTAFPSTSRLDGNYSATGDLPAGSGSLGQPYYRPSHTGLGNFDTTIANHNTGISPSSLYSGDAASVSQPFTVGSGAPSNYLNNLSSSSFIPSGQLLPNPFGSTVFATPAQYPGGAFGSAMQSATGRQPTEKEMFDSFESSDNVSMPGPIFSPFAAQVCGQADWDLALPPFPNTSSAMADLTKRTIPFARPGAVLPEATYGNLHRIVNGTAPSQSDMKDIQDLLANIGRENEDGDEEDETPSELRFPLYLHQSRAKKFMTDREEGKNRGGILADDMGLGKTVTTLALIVSRQPQKSQLFPTNATRSSSADYPPDAKGRKCTLIICPRAIITQWRQEIKDKLLPEKRLTVFVHHAKKGKFDELRSCDVVITTYGTLTAEYKKLDKYLKDGNLELDDVPNNARDRFPLLHPKARWFRVVLDESQYVKNRNALCSRAVRRLDSLYRWCLTGTPMMNNIDELYALLAFLNIRPYCDYEKFKSAFRSLTAGRGSMHERGGALEKLRACLAAVMLRRTKATKINGKPIITLPEKSEEHVHVVFDEEEERYYRGLEQRNVDIFNKFNREGTVGKNYAIVLVLLLRLRQVCCHPHLNTDVDPTPSQAELDEQLGRITGKITGPAVDLIKKGIEDRAFACAVCEDAALNPSFFPECGHSVCDGCMTGLRADVEAEKLRVGDDNGSDSTSCRQCGTPVNVRDTFRLAAFRAAYDLPEPDTPNAHDGKDDSEDDSDESNDEKDAAGHHAKDEVNEKGDLKDFIVDDDDGGFEIPDSQEAASDAEEPSTLSTELPDLSALITPSASPHTGATTPGSTTTDRKDGVSVKYEADIEDADDSNSDYDLEKAEADLRGSTRADLASRSCQNPSERTLAFRPATSSGKSGKRKSKSKATIRDVKATELDILRKDARTNKAARDKYMTYLMQNWQPSAKTTKFKELVQQICSETNDKVIVFSSFTGFLDLLEIPLLDLSINYDRFDGSMTADQREKALTRFREHSDIRVLLVSLKAGNAGLNLTVANKVIIMDPYWNPFIEMQAVDRTYRIGQQKPVHVHRILVKNSIEDRILELQDRKKDLVDAALDENKTASLTRLSREELGFLFGANST